MKRPIIKIAEHSSPVPPYLLPLAPQPIATMHAWDLSHRCLAHKSLATI